MDRGETPVWPEHVPEKLIDFSGRNMLQPVDLEHLPVARMNHPERKMLWATLKRRPGGTKRDRSPVARVVPGALRSSVSKFLRRMNIQMRKQTRGETVFGIRHPQPEDI